MSSVGEVERFAREKFAKADMNWFVKMHLEYVEKFSLILAEKKNANKDVLRLSVWLHDINHDKVKENHHMENAAFAVELLAKQGFDAKIVKAVEHCILTHSCKNDHIPQTLEAKILASADAMSHIDNFSVLLFVAFVIEKYDTKRAHEWLSRKIDRDWNKILIHEGKEIIKNKYEEAMEALKHMEKQLNK